MISFLSDLALTDHRVIRGDLQKIEIRQIYASFQEACRLYSGWPNGIVCLRRYFLHQKFYFFTPIFSPFYTKILKFRKPFFGKNGCKKAKKMVYKKQKIDVKTLNGTFSDFLSNFRKILIQKKPENVP